MTGWGWPGPAGLVTGGRTTTPPAVACLLPQALALALVIRRIGPECPTSVAVAGAGFPARLAEAVTRTLGLPVAVEAAAGVDLPGTPLTIAATASPDELDRVIAACPERGTLIAMGAALASAPRNYYREVHYRSLTLWSVPASPLPAEIEQETTRRDADALAAALREVTPAADEPIPLRGLPGARLARETASGWLSLRVGQ